jgi:hypothetical protein
MEGLVVEEEYGSVRFKEGVGVSLKRTRLKRTRITKRISAQTAKTTTRTRISA